jgi:hypothetical protein
MYWPIVWKIGLIWRNCKNFCLGLQESGREQVSDDEEKPVQPDDDRVQEVSDMQAESPPTRYGVGTGLEQ